MKRVVIYPKDVMILTGKSERSSREILKKIRVLKAKEKHHQVSIEEFCEYMGLRIEEVNNALR